MSFVYPLGLLGLIGIPILIAIYIIKNKYTEQVVTSTYLWTLSERFLKKRLPINKLMGIISLILQIIAVLFISLAVSQPVLFIRNAAHDYCFVLDGSGSMNIERDGVTRFETAKGEISAVINNSMKGSAYTLVFVGNTTDRIFEGITDKERALTLLNDVSASYTVAGYTDAIGVAQNYFNENTSVLTYLVTDKSFKDSENVNVINVSSKEENYAVYGGSAEDGNDDGYRISCNVVDDKLEVSAYVMSYESDAKLTVELYVDGAEEAADTRTVDVVKLQPTEVVLTAEQNNYQSVKVVIVEEDSLSYDNQITVYNVQYENSYTVLLVSDEPSIFVEAALQSAGNAIVSKVTAREYKRDEDAYLSKDYGLFIYESCTPESLPRNSAVWLLNPTASVAGSGFALQDEVDLGTGGTIKLKFNTSTSSVVKKLTESMSRDERGNSSITVANKYQQCRLYNSFTTLLYAGGSPVVFAGTNDYNNREVVFAYDVHWSDSALLTDYVILFRNLLNFTFPNVIENTLTYCGNTLEISVPANCQSIRVDSPEGNVNYLDPTSAVCELALSEVGTYVITLSTGDNSREYSVYSYLPSEESVPTEESELSFSLEGEAGNKRRNGIYDDLLAIFILLAVVFAADWVVYCYEQYQLR